jgi:tetratricopeptide (TPR) repeat protein
MASESDKDLRERAEWMIARVEGENPSAAVQLVEELRNAREYPLLLRLAEAIGRKRPDQHRVRRLQAQALIEQGQTTIAIDVLERLSARLKKDDPEYLEAMGLLGRAHKQIFFDALDQASPAATQALQAAIRAYRGPFEHDARNTWHGVNLIALLARIARDGMRMPRGLDLADTARRVQHALAAVPPDKQDDWHHATCAEVAVALADWPAVEAALKLYVGRPTAKAFMVQSTLRQFRQVWELDREPSGHGTALLELLQARLLQLGGPCQLSPAALAEARNEPKPSLAMLEAVLGREGVSTLDWWKRGLDCAAAVCSVRERLADRVGTGWLVRASNLGLGQGDECVVVTNFHVVNAEGLGQGKRPDEVELVFEAVEPQRPLAVVEILFSSPPERHDVAVLRFEGPPPVGVKPLELARGLPLRGSPSRVFVIGHAGGRELAFSLQDNELIDHEGPTTGKPAIAGVCRLHYRAPTEGGSSGSPVFNAKEWKVIALHHSGGKLGMPKLNGEVGTYPANEGIGMQSIVEAIKTSAVQTRVPPAPSP